MLDECAAKATTSRLAGPTMTSAAEELATGSVGGLTGPVCDQSGNGQPGAANPRLPNGRPDLNGCEVRSTGVGRSESTWELMERPSLLRDARVLIVDDCTLYREYLEGVIAAHGSITPAVAWDLSSLITAFEDTLPRVILLNMATRDSSMLLRQALKVSPSVRVIVMGVSEDDESEIVTCAEAGVAGYHLRTESIEDLLVSIHKVAAGESLCSPRVSAILLRRLSALASQRQPVSKEPVLTEREAQILRMLELGLSNRDIATQLCIAVHTVKNHVHSLLTKLGVSTRAQAAALSRTIRYTEA
jgi:DNA-binding NarL/FixJ family response regulator